MRLVAVALFALVTTGCHDHWRQQCMARGAAMEREVKYEADIDGGTCFIRCAHGWEYADRGCNGATR